MKNLNNTTDGDYSHPPVKIFLLLAVLASLILLGLICAPMIKTSLSKDTKVLGGIGEIKNPGSIVKQKLPLLIDFTSQGNSDQYIKNGFYDQEETHRWSKGDQATLAFLLPETSDSVQMNIRLVPFLNDKTKSQRSKIKCNGVTVGKLIADQRDTRLKLEIPGKIWNSQSLKEIEFDFPDAISPKDAEVGNDTTKLAWAFKSIQIQNTDNP